MGVKLEALASLRLQMGYNVSVPLRGNGCETVGTDYPLETLIKFPSPCGVMGVKQNEKNYSRMRPTYLGFPSPCGVMGVKRKPYFF